MANQNQFILAADNSPNLLPLLRSHPHLASSQDPHGYSILHAAASYNHLDLLRTVINEFPVDINIKDEDGEIPLFVVETVEAAQVLVEELGADLTIKNAEGMTAEEKILADGDYPTIAAFLRECRLQKSAEEGQNFEAHLSEAPLSSDERLPPLPSNVLVNVSTMDEESAVGVDPDFKRRIEDLAARGDFQGEDGQRELRKLIADAVRTTGNSKNTRDVRRRIE